MTQRGIQQNALPIRSFLPARTLGLQALGNLKKHPWPSAREGFGAWPSTRPLEAWEPPRVPASPRPSTSPGRERSCQLNPWELCGAYDSVTQWYG